MKKNLPDWLMDGENVVAFFEVLLKAVQNDESELKSKSQKFFLVV